MRGMFGGRSVKCLVLIESVSFARLSLLLIFRIRLQFSSLRALSWKRFFYGHAG